MKYLIQFVVTLSMVCLAGGFAACSEENGAAAGTVQPPPGTDGGGTDEGDGDKDEINDTIMNNRINITVAAGRMLRRWPTTLRHGLLLPLCHLQ